MATSCEGANYQARIVGGSEVTPYSIPWQVGLVNPGSNSVWCGGTLISDQHVLTAAHCTASSIAKFGIDVMVGEHDILDNSDGTRHQICKFRNHPKYSINSPFDHDYAILHLKKPVKLGYRAIPACLPEPNFSSNKLVGKNLTVSGWGHLQSGGVGPDVLHSVNVPAISQQECKKFYHGINGLTVTDSMICAGHTDGGIDACQGDSGGKLTNFPIKYFLLYYDYGLK